MPLKEFLREGEQILYRSRVEVKHDGDGFEVIVTDTRLVLYAKGDQVSLSPVGGVVSLKNDHVVAEEESAIRNIRYFEKGFFDKTGTIEVHGGKLLTLTGPAKALKEIFRALHTHLPSGNGAPSRLQ
ncbi:MAG: hypothetical protein ACE5PO_04705 [Candidatus Bathyarchaeia archaeon]